MSWRPALAAIAIAAMGPGWVEGQSRSRGEWTTDFSRHTVPLEEIVSGGPPKDGIPAIDHPTFVAVKDADRWLRAREPVVVVTDGDAAKAYPIQILIWHEIVNDVVGTRPVSVTYCPLCNTALAFDRRLDGVVLDFGTTGRLRHSDLVMYDRQSESWWQQASGEGIVGVHAGRRLEFVSAPVVSWAAYKGAYPEGQVLSRKTGFDRPYGKNPYAGYDDPSGSPIASFFRRRIDQRLPAMERVVAISLDGEDVAVPFARFQERPVVDVEIGDRPVTLFWSPGTASALDDGEISKGRDVGATGVFDRRLDGRTLEFDPAGPGAFTDRQTGSRWDILGRAVDGTLRGAQLTPVPHGNHFWFAWAAFKPTTRLIGSPAGSR